MENNHREQSIGDKLRNHQETVDSSALWEGIKHQIPIKKKKSYWPVPLVFLLGAGLGFGITEFSYKNKFNTLKNNNKHLNDKIEQLHQSLKTCSQQKTKEILTAGEGAKPEKTNLPSVSKNQIIPLLTPPVDKAENKIAQVIPATEMNHKQNDHEVKSLHDTGLFPEIMTLPTPLLPLNHTTSRKVNNNPTYKTSHPEKAPLVWFFEMAGGPSLVSDRTSENNEFPTTKHTSVFQTQLDAGIQKQLVGKWYGNLGIFYQFAASTQAYHTSAYDKIFITDTVGIFIGADGVTQTEVGDVLAQRWISKNGQAFHTRHLVSLRPGLEYEVFGSKGKHLSLAFSLVIPVWYQNSGSLVNASSGKHLLTKNQFVRPEWPWSVSLYYQWPLQKSNLGLLLRVHHDKQKIVFNDNIYARNFWLPQAGMRILF